MPWRHATFTPRRVSSTPPLPPLPNRSKPALPKRTRPRSRSMTRSPSTTSPGPILPSRAGPPERDRGSFSGVLGPDLRISESGGNWNASFELVEDCAMGRMLEALRLAEVKRKGSAEVAPAPRPFQPDGDDCPETQPSNPGEEETDGE